MRLILFPYKMSSGGGRRLAEALGALRVYPDGKYKPREGDVIINYGNGIEPAWWEQASYLNDFKVLNWPYNVANATDKRRAFHEFEAGHVSIPPYTLSVDEAYGWLHEGKIVCERLKVQGHSAEGLIIHTDPEAKLHGRLFTEYVKKKHEYRVHIAFGTIIDITQKKLRTGLPGKADYQIRNHDGGWVYTRKDVNCPARVMMEAERAMNVLGLDFGAVDVGWNEHQQMAYVYEVNTAPGLYNTTLYRYAKAFSEWLGIPLKMEDPGNYGEDMVIENLEDMIPAGVAGDTDEIAKALEV